MSRLAPHSRLGPYEILSALGVGGMGEVYRARDTKLGRDVAIKVLLPAVANDPERLARFKREAKILASLNHPNIGGIHGLEDGNGVTALVLELVEGPTLADRIVTGPIPLNEALSIARQIADALEAAHASGIVHRDLKPANIKITQAGAVKVLDFGLAKAAAPAPSPERSSSATETTAVTCEGTILGTFAYMSPEQAAGKIATHRSDLWAFGVILLEMLTRRPVFTGETSSLYSRQCSTASPTGPPCPLRCRRRFASCSGAAWRRTAGDGSIRPPMREWRSTTLLRPRHRQRRRP